MRGVGTGSGAARGHWRLLGVAEDKLEEGIRVRVGTGGLERAVYPPTETIDKAIPCQLGVVFPRRSRWNTQEPRAQVDVGAFIAPSLYVAMETAELPVASLERKQDNIRRVPGIDDAAELDVPTAKQLDVNEMVLVVRMNVARVQLPPPGQRPNCQHGTIKF